MTFKRLGEWALIIGAETREEVLRWWRLLDAAELTGVQESLPCYTSLTVFFRGRDYHDLMAEIKRTLSTTSEELSAPVPTVHKIPVCYEGAYSPDLAEVAERLGMSAQEVVARHSAPLYEVAGLGFSPGFAFLEGLDSDLHLPRRATPRVAVPVGSVGIAGGQSGVYPTETSGGWNLIGRTPMNLVDYSADYPSLFEVGDKVRFVPIPAEDYTEPQESYYRPVSVPAEGAAEVLRVGGVAMIQDLGRTRFRSQGVPSGGAMDQQSVTRLNALLGNKADAPVVEFFQVGVRVGFNAQSAVVVGGAVLPTLNGLKRSPWCIISVAPGDVLEIGALRGQLWGYLAILGGFQVQPYLGSVSTHPHLKVGGLGLLSVGDTLPYDSHCSENDGKGLPRANRRATRVMRCIPGAQWDWFSEEERSAFQKTSYALTDLVNRVGYRLQGKPLKKLDSARELSSEGACPGAIQVTNSGQPLVLMADAQSIGGYPKIAHIIEEDLSAFSQLIPGEKVQFRFIGA